MKRVSLWPIVATNLVYERPYIIQRCLKHSPAGSQFAGVFWGVWSRRNFPFPRIRMKDAWQRANPSSLCPPGWFLLGAEWARAEID